MLVAKKKQIKILPILTVIVLALSVIYSGAMSVGAVKASKVDICHYDKDSGLYRLININSNALEAHKKHGDAIDGSPIFNNGCQTKAIVYNSIPNPVPGNFPSVGFEATSTSEFGGLVALTGTVRTNPTVTIYMSSWGCESGGWTTGDCLTTAGATFSQPITLNIYSVGAGNSVGTLIDTSTKLFDIPYRPSTDPTCTGGRWKDYNGTCYNGFATPITFELPGVTLPDNVIVSVAYNTSHYGKTPYTSSAPCYTESGGCGYDSLNVAVQSMSGINYPLPDGVYMNSTWAGAYGDNGVAGTGTFRLDPTSWTGYQPVISIATKL